MRRVSVPKQINQSEIRPKFVLVSVDGRARSACLRRVWDNNLVAPGGMLMRDNSMRAQYASARQPFDKSTNWTSIEFRSLGIAGLSEVGTTLWCRLR